MEEEQWQVAPRVNLDEARHWILDPNQSRVFAVRGFAEGGYPERAEKMAQSLRRAAESLLRAGASVPLRQRLPGDALEETVHGGRPRGLGIHACRM